MSEEHHSDGFYIKTWGILLVLLTISVVGPMFEIQVLTLVTAFGIACVKAYLVATRFMHINLTPRFVPYLVATSLVFMLLFFAGVAPDVMKEEGSGWEKPAWKAASAAHAAGETEDSGAGHH
jgi:caa(3)-type oxidase subunit IV